MCRRTMLIMNEENQNPQPVTPPTSPEPADVSSASLTPEAAALDASSAATAAAKPKMSGKKKALIIGIVLLLVAAASAAVWYFVLRDKPGSSPAPATVAPAEEKVLKPSQIIFSDPDANGSNATLDTVPIMGGDQTTAAGVGGVLGVDVEKNQVVAHTQQTTDTEVTTNIFYSSDSGKTFASLLEFKEPVGPNAIDRTFITSAKLSSDGQKVIYGLSNTGAANNTVKSLDIASKKTEDLFTVNQLGVYLEGFDSKTQTAYYFSGCAQCDGVSFNKLLSRVVGQADENVVYDRPNTFGWGLEFNNDFSKAVVTTGTGNGFDLHGPYNVEELTLSTKAFRSVATSPDKRLNGGYAADKVSVYYSEDNNVYSVDASNKKVLAFQANGPIQSVAYVGLDYVVAEVGEISEHSTVTFDIKQNKAVTVLPVKVGTIVYGVVWE